MKHVDTTVRYKKTVNFEDIVDDEEFEDAKMKFVFQPGDLNQMLKEKGYVDEIRKAMLDFKNNHINGYPICVAFLTGGASRMNFLTQLLGFAATFNLSRSRSLVNYFKRSCRIGKE